MIISSDIQTDVQIFIRISLNAASYTTADNNKHNYNKTKT